MQSAKEWVNEWDDKCRQMVYGGDGSEDRYFWFHAWMEIRQIRIARLLWIRALGTEWMTDEQQRMLTENERED